MIKINLTEDQEFDLINDILKREIPKFRNRLKQIDNIPYKQVISSDYLKTKDKLYSIKYKDIREDKSVFDYKYIFSLDIAKKIKNCMINYTMDLHKHLYDCFSKYQFNHYTKDYINDIIFQHGFGNIRIIDITNSIEKIYNEPIKVKNKHNTSCDYCGDGGCFVCEPYRFI